MLIIWTLFRSGVEAIPRSIPQRGAVRSGALTGMVSNQVRDLVNGSQLDE